MKSYQTENKSVTWKVTNLPISPNKHTTEILKCPTMRQIHILTEFWILPDAWNIMRDWGG